MRFFAIFFFVVDAAVSTALDAGDNELSLVSLIYYDS